MRWVPWLVPWLAAGCLSKPDYTGGGGGDDNADANIIFVTSESRLGGQLGSIEEADAWCAQLAARATPPLPANRYVAWLSTSTSDVFDRLTAVAPSGWVRPDGKPVARTLQALVDGEHLYPPRVNELGTDFGDTDPQVITGTLKGGRAAPNTCGDYTNTGALGQYGAPDAASNGWTEITSGACDVGARIYCLGVERSATVTVTPPASARTAFVSAGTVSPIMGRMKFDERCATEAAAKQLPGVYLAAVAIAPLNIAMRFDPGPPWVRQDGVVVLEGDFSKMHAPIALDLDGNRRDDYALSGVESFTLTTEASSTCNNWNVVGSGTFHAGWTMRSEPRGALSDTRGDCNTDPYRIYCLQNN